MKTTKPQLAELWKGDLFMGYALAIDGLLIDGTQRSVVETLPGQPATISIEVSVHNLDRVRLDMTND